MNKKLYLLVLGAASLALQPVNARSQFTKKQVAKVVNTDVAISLATSSDSDHTVIIVPNIISVVKPADMPVVSFGSKKEDQLLGCDLIYNSDSLNVLPTRTFDEKGRLAYVKSPGFTMLPMEKKKQDIDYVMWMLLIDQPNLSKFSRMVNGRSLRFLMRPLNWNWATMNSVLTMNSIRTDM